VTAKTAGNGTTDRHLKKLQGLQPAAVYCPYQQECRIMGIGHNPPMLSLPGDADRLRRHGDNARELSADQVSILFNVILDKFSSSKFEHIYTQQL
jgi:hypothetical protein